MESHLQEHLNNKTWKSIKGRVLGSKERDKINYTDRGITVCSTWLNDYDAFLRDMGRKPAPHYQIDRIDNNKGYEPGNCRWVTIEVQSQNRRNIKTLIVNGEAIPLPILYRKHGIGRSLCHSRLRRGWSIEEALSPLDHRGSGLRKRIGLKP